MNSNIIQCPKCKHSFINEEYPNHVCMKLQVTVFDTWGNRWGSYDSINFFRLPPFPRLSDDLLQQDKTKRSDEDVTEPYNEFRQVCVG